MNYKANYNRTKVFNKEYEYYVGEITGNQLATVINKAIDSNIKNEVDKNDKGIFINNNINSINIEIKMKDNNKLYNMEAIYNKGIKEFVSYYGDIIFKCTIVKYHKNTNKISYMLYEQITI